MKRFAFFLYGLISYVLFLGVFVYAIGFLGNAVVPKSIDSGAERPFVEALLINVGLLGVFAIQHSGMARPAFKAWWTKIVPEPIERATYVLTTNVLMIALFWLWEPMGGQIWSVESGLGQTILFTLYGCGWALLLYSTFLINHFDLFGLRQVVLHLQKKEYKPLKFRVPGAYRMVRHPLYVGWLMIFWCTPSMTVARLVFAVLCTGYILVAIQLEERDLVKFFGRHYEEYRRRVPMLLPIPRAQKAVVSTESRPT